MAKKQRKRYILANRDFMDIDLTDYEDVILDTVNRVVPGKHVKVYPDYFEIDMPTQKEAVQLGRELAKLKEFSGFGKHVTQYRLFAGRRVEP